MRKLLISLLALPLCIVSCSHGEGVVPVMLPEPKTLDYAQMIVLDEPLTVSGMDIVSIELTEASRYIVEYLASETKAEGSSTLHVKVGHFSVSGGKFLLEELGVLEFDGVEATLGEQSVPASSMKAEPMTLEESNASRNWKVKNIFLTVSGGSLGQGVSIEKRFDALDFYGIASYLRTSGVSLTEEEVSSLEGYDVTELHMTGLGSFVVDFSGAESVKGSFVIDGDDFSYAIPKDTNPIHVGGEASGTLLFNAAAQTACMLAEVTIHGHSSDYTVGVELNLYEVE